MVKVRDRSMDTRKPYGEMVGPLIVNLFLWTIDFMFIFLNRGSIKRRHVAVSESTLVLLALLHHLQNAQPQRLPQLKHYKTNFRDMVAQQLSWPAALTN